MPDEEVIFRYNPGDLSRVWVWMPHRNQYLEAPINENWRTYAQGLSLWQHNHILEYERGKVDEAFNPGALSRARSEIVAIFAAALENRHALRKAHRELARTLGNGRLAFAGEREETSPPGSHQLIADRKPPRKSKPKPVAEPDENDNPCLLPELRARFAV